MLDFVQAFTGCSYSDVHILSLPTEILIAHASDDCVVLVNARTLAFKQALAFSDIFPVAEDSNAQIKCISIEPGMKLVAASRGPYIVIWCLSDTQAGVWRIHSSLTVAHAEDVTAIDCKSGLLGVGSTSELSVYTLNFEDGFLVWTKKWCALTENCFSVVRFSPSLMYLATISVNDHAVRIYSTATGNLLQVLHHPRPVKDFIWRFSEKSSRDDHILYTVTIDSTIRIFLPVLDTPHFLQLHATLDRFSELKHPIISNIFWLHKDTMTSTFSATLPHSSPSLLNTAQRRLKEIYDQGWDLFIGLHANNSLIIRALANLDRRPPTFLKQFTILRSIVQMFTLDFRHLHVVKMPNLPSLIFVTSPPLRTYEVDPLEFFGNESRGMTVLAQATRPDESDPSEIIRFVRAPEGKGFAVRRENCVEVWRQLSNAQLKLESRWPRAQLVAVLENREGVALYTEEDGNFTVTIHYTAYPKQSKCIMVPQLISLFCIASRSNSPLLGISAQRDVILINSRSSIDAGLLPELSITQTRLPTSSVPASIIPIDSMKWNSLHETNDCHTADVLLSIAEDGELAFWSMTERFHLSSWVCSGRVKTEPRKYRMARCSSVKKTALVNSDSDGDELTIWDSRVSEFTSGLEYRHVFKNESISSLDWTSTPDQQSILAIGFPHHVLLVCQQRTTYFEEKAAWGSLGRVEIKSLLSHPITDSNWLAGGTLLVGAGHFMLQYDQRKLSASGNNEMPGLFQLVASMNGPLPDYHPQMILQCLLWGTGKIEFVKETIMNLYSYLKRSHGVRVRSMEGWTNVSVERLLNSGSMENEGNPTHKRRVDIFDGPPNIQSIGPREDPELTQFSRSVVQFITDQLEISSIKGLTSNEVAHLIVLLQTTVEIDEQRRALDSNGLRYLISMRSFYILNARLRQPQLPVSSNIVNVVSPERSFARDRLRYRDMIWAFHSESQDMLLNASMVACGGKMKWEDAKALGIFLWLKSKSSMRNQMEIIARSHYMSEEQHDPVSCSLFYFALGKVNLVRGLWKQASWNKEQTVTLKFLSNDFGQQRWKTAALKNAFVLLSKQRFEYAAAFFILGGSLKDAVHVCVKYMNDPQLAIALARVAGEENEPILKDLLRNIILPIAFEKGNRWLGSWAFWLLNRRDLAVRILVSPLQDILVALDFRLERVDTPNYDDPSLALLFSQLKSKSLQTAKGVNEISDKMEFNFVLQTARVFWRMGCHPLALDLLKSWSFERPTSRFVRKFSRERGDTVGPLENKFGRSVFAFQGHLRRPSIAIDMDVASGFSTRSTTPENTVSENTRTFSRDSQSMGQNATSKAGLGSLMKSARQDISVPEFDIGAFL